LGKTRCTECNDEIKDEEVFVHEGKPYCPECTIDHVKAKHAELFRTLNR